MPPSCTYSSFFFFSSRRRHTRSLCDWSSDVCSSDLGPVLLHLQWAERDVQGASFEQTFHGEAQLLRSEERRVGKECRSRWEVYHKKKKRKEIKNTDSWKLRIRQCV